MYLALDYAENKEDGNCILAGAASDIYNEAVERFRIFATISSLCRRADQEGGRVCSKTLPGSRIRRTSLC